MRKVLKADPADQQGVLMNSEQNDEVCDPARRKAGQAATKMICVTVAGKIKMYY
ncbi:MAG: hypothetical protein JNM19_19605 [Chitinophagaceae bacterium]|nr:hypothetical protein [Chitinophagaceae bacterium]